MAAVTVTVAVLSDTRHHHRRRIVGRLAEEQQHDHPDVEVGGDGAGDDADDHQRSRTALCGRLEHRELADEATGQRDTREGEQEQREHHADKGMLPPEPRPPGHVHLLFTGGIAHQAHHGEGAKRAEAVGEQVEQRRRQAVGVQRDDAGQDEADVRHRGVGQHALHVASATPR